LHTRILDGLRKHVFDSITPARLVALIRLGETRDYVSGEELVGWFFSYFDFPKLTSERAIRDAIASGVAEHFGYVSAAHLENDVVVPSRLELVRFGSVLPADEVDLGPGCFLLSARLASKLRGTPDRETATTRVSSTEVATEGEEPQRQGTTATDVGRAHYRLQFRADAAQLFRALPALQNLADRAALFTATIDVEAEGKEAFDRAWLRNAVEEHLDEAGVDAQTSLS
jgi:hypothetical protein